jgi:hypothetical protein
MAVTAVGYTVVAAWMMVEPGLLVEAKEFLVWLPYCEEAKAVKAKERAMGDMAKQG